MTLKVDNSVIQSSIDSTADTKLAGIKNVGVPGNKAVVLYDNKIDYLKHTGNDAITRKSTRYIGTADITYNSYKQYKVAISCLCENIDRLACFSGTLSFLLERQVVFVIILWILQLIGESDGDVKGAIE